MRDEEQGEIDAKMRESRISANKTAMRLSLIFVIIYVCLRLSHWIFNFPEAQSTINALGITLGAIWTLVVIDLCVDMLISEFRIRSNGIDRKLSSLQDQLTELASAFNSSNPVRQEDKTESDESLVARYHASAEHGEVWGQYCLAVTYSNGDRLPKDKALAAFWYRKAAEQGDIPSMQFLADLLAGGHGVEPDYAEAVRLYKIVADSGHVYSTMAEYNLGEMYAEGKGIPRDVTEAVKYWKRAAEHGWDLAATQLERLQKQEGIAPNVRAI
jgi:TPR repeat protein